MNVRNLGGTDWNNSWDRFARVRAKPHLDETDCMNSVRPISTMRKQRVGQANSVGLIAHLGETKIITIGNREFARPSR